MRRLTHLAFAFAVLAALLAPAALASGSRSKGTQHTRPGCANASAVCVYYDGGLGSADGSQQGGKGGKLSPRLERLIDKYGGKDKALLRRLAEVSIFGHNEPQSGAGNASGSSALGAIFDMGAGPLALFATLLAGTALGVGRVLRHRRAGQA